ncbi:phosphate transport system protein [Kineosphaera limosa]|uniref:Phosphate-specific transport system accessory protein PhoU n=1 Tax=Kineosphaera limosa NBRC 100340 TaxID=1184609 RepID=K6XAL5_9MICO|nr:phosphate signaling complex protein PhoU [Kineosphaera limosa]NYD99739.1 phosphate transport system protein [Kineosphaera limosa]GAB95839.1 phosphate transport system regulatory protein [Kineosphaera limosa NBRC 100340]
MRDAFHEDLDKISDSLVEMTRLVGSAMSRATTALLDSDLGLAEGVIENDVQIDAIRDDIDEMAVQLIAQQQPVATDLRIVVTALHMASSLERMGDLAEHVAKVARLRYPHKAVPPQANATIVEMAQIAERLVAQAGSIIAAKDVDGAEALHADDDEMDRLHRDMFVLLVDEGWEGGTESAIDVTLLARYFERFADHAVSVARQVAYLVTGEWEHKRRVGAPA